MRSVPDRPRGAVGGVLPGRPDRAGVRTPGGDAAPPGVGGRRRGPAVAAPALPRRPGCSGSPSPRRSAGRAGRCSTRWRCRRRSSRRVGPPGWPRRCSPAGSRCRTWRRTARPSRSTRSSGRRWPARRSARSRSPSPVAGPTSRASPPTAVRDGDTYVVNGAKTFITSGVRADFVTTAVRTGGPGHAGVSLLVVEKGTPGFTVDRGLAKMGWHCSDTAELSFVDVRVPGGQPGRRGERRLLPDRRAVRGRADRAGRARLRHRGPLARADRGVLPRARDLRQAADRQPGGAAQARRDAQAGRGGAHLHPRGRGASRAPANNVIAEACLAKQTAVEACDHVVDQAVQLHGGTGYMHGTEVERHYRDARILGIGGGATEVLTDLSARLLGYAMTHE